MAPRERSGPRPITDLGVIPFGDEESLIRLQAVVIVQHPNGGYKKIALRNNQTVEHVDPRFIRYFADTHRGSSGSPVFNLKGQLVALHHTGIPKVNANGDWLTRKGEVFDVATMSDDDVEWISNEGVAIQEIARALKRPQNGVLGSDAALLGAIFESRRPTADIGVSRAGLSRGAPSDGGATVDSPPSTTAVGAGVSLSTGG
ncbi:MAG: serine protease, partial [Polyangiaceae bacterium]